MRNFYFSVARSITGLLILGGGIALPAFAEQPNANIQPKPVSMQCGNHIVVIKCGKKFNPEYPQDKRHCNDNKLSFVDSNGNAFIPPAPKNFDASKTPVAMHCRQSKKNGKYFVEVEFNNGPPGCLPCMTFNLFGENGERLTSEPTNDNRILGRISNKLKLYDIGKRFEIEPDPFLQRNLKGD